MRVCLMSNCVCGCYGEAGYRVGYTSVCCGWISGLKSSQMFSFVLVFVEF